MRIAIAGGHSAAAPGAAGLLDEYQCDRAYTSKLKGALSAAGHEVVDCTNEMRTANEELAEECRAANESGADLFVAVHFNAGGGTGVEAWHYPGDVYGEGIAQALAANISAALGLPDRGPKASSGYWVLNETNMTAIVLETCFVDREEDAAAWHAAPWDVLCDAFVGAIEGRTVEDGGSETYAPSEEASSGSADDDFHGGTYRCTVSDLNVRDAPTLRSAVVASYHENQTVVLDDWYTVCDGYVWGRYTAYSGNVRYIAVGRATGSPEPDDFLVRA